MTGSDEEKKTTSKRDDVNSISRTLNCFSVITKQKALII